MLGIVLYVSVGVVVLMSVRASFKIVEKKQIKVCDRLKETVLEHREKFVSTVNKISAKDEKVHHIFALYEIARNLAYILEIDKLIDTFVEKLEAIDGIDSVIVDERKKIDNYKSYSIDDGNLNKYLHVKSEDSQLHRQIPYLISQYNILIDRALIYKKLQKMSITDYLTNIPNRRHFMERFRQEYTRAAKFSLSLSFLIIDIDYFKKINDTYGHLVGDEILRQVALTLSEKIREIDFIGRYGGEEFVVFLSESDEKSAMKAAQRLRERVESTEFKVYDEKMQLTISVGLCTYPKEAQDKDKFN